MNLTVEEVEAHIKALRSEVRELRAQYRKHKYSVENRLERLEQSQQPAGGDVQTSLMA